MHVAELMMPTS